MLLKEDPVRFSAVWSTFAICRSPSCCCSRQEAVDLVYPGASTTLRNCALFHGFDHIHLNLGYFGTKGLSSI
jgi:hypothetical protein